MREFLFVLFFVVLALGGIAYEVVKFLAYWKVAAL